MFVRILEWSTCNVCMEIHEQIVFYQSPDGLEFSICRSCLQAAQQMFAPDPPTACPDCGSVDEHIHYANCPLAKTAGR